MNWITEVKTYPNYYSNQAKRRKDPTIRQIKKGEVTSRLGEQPKVAQPFLVPVQADSTAQPIIEGTEAVATISEKPIAPEGETIHE